MAVSHDDEFENVRISPVNKQIYLDERIICFLVRGRVQM